MNWYGKVRRLTVLFCLSIILMLSTGCGSSGAEEVALDEILINAHAAMNAFDGYHFLIITEGKDVFLDENQTIILKQAEGDYASPDRVAGTIKIAISTMVAEVSIINIGDSKWETNPIFGTWQESTTDYAFRPLEILDPDSGIIAVIAEDTTDLALESEAALEELPGQELLKLSGSLSGTRISQLSYGLIDDETLSVEMWITPDTYEINRIMITDPANSAEEVDTNWLIDFWNFGETPDIQPPL
jgi:hypothetical protein